MSNTETKWITIREAIQDFGLSDATIRRYIKRNNIKWEYSQVLRRYRIDKQSLLEYINYRGRKE